MKRCLFTTTCLITLSFVALLAGCGGKRIVPLGQISGESEVTNVDVPDWFINLPQDPNFLYAAASSDSVDLQHAMNTAKEEGRAEIARQMQMKMSAMFKRFREEVGSGENAELISMETDVSKSVASEMLVGSVPRKQEVKKEGKNYRAYVLMEMAIGPLNQSVLEKVKEREKMYTLYRASKGFQELEEEVEKYEQSKKEQEGQ